MRFSSLAVVSVLLVGASIAQDGAEASAQKLDAVRALHSDYTKVRDRMHSLTDEMRKAERGSDKQKELSALLGELRGGLAAPQKAFSTAFLASDWTKFDPKADAALLKDGLPAVARETATPDKAIAAGKLYLEHFGAERSAEMIRANALPMALLAAGKTGDAIATLNEAIERAEGAGKVRIMLTLGDVFAAQGDVESALEKYTEAEALADKDSARYVTLRKELIGKPAPDIDTKTWIGGDARTLGSLAGKVVLVDFWATWCPPCRAVMPSLDEMYRKHQTEGLEVIGLTRSYPNGYLPANKEQMQQGGQSLKGITEAEFPEHVATFRKNTEISYPFAIGAESDFKNYHVSSIPTLAVVGRDGNIALVTVGSGSEPLLHFAVQQLLAKK